MTAEGLTDLGAEDRLLLGPEGLPLPDRKAIAECHRGPAIVNLLHLVALVLRSVGEDPQVVSGLHRERLLGGHAGEAELMNPQAGADGVLARLHLLAEDERPIEV